jgi:hypothetical protein
MKRQSNSKFDLIVIEKDRIGKGQSICYYAPVPGVDFLEPVEDFFEDAGVEVEPEVVEKIAETVFNKGFCLWNGFQFEMLIK